MEALPLQTCPTCPILSGQDLLTGAQDRGAFMRELGTRLEAGAGFALLLMDLDGFKGVNDTLGHAAGDRLLRAVADRLRRLLREGDVLARLGGDEFAILLPLLSDGELVSVSGRLVNMISRPFLLEGRAAQVGASIGCARFPADAGSAEELLRMADLALYSAKSAGRGRMAFASRDLREDADNRCALEQELRRALPLGQWRILLQPKHALPSRKPSGFEALLRWDHPQDGLLAPDRFMEVLERTGLIVEVGAWVMGEAAQAAGRLFGPVAVNLSGAQFASGQLPALVGRTLARADIAPARLEVELLETAIFPRPEEAFAQLRAIRDMGVRVALDDFGTGHSSLALLRAFPFDRVKLDRSFLISAETDPRSRAIIRAVASLARDLGAEVTAEGIETEAQLALVQALGCTGAQGFIFGRPAPLSAEAAAA